MARTTPCLARGKKAWGSNLTYKSYNVGQSYILLYLLESYPILLQGWASQAIFRVESNYFFHYFVSVYIRRPWVFYCVLLFTNYKGVFYHVPKKSQIQKKKQSFVRRVFLEQYRQYILKFWCDLQQHHFF
jgi:hypothetical protein